MSKFLMSIVIAVIIFTAPLKSDAVDISTSEIVSESLSLDCLEYRITGVCLFLICYAYYCEINVVPAISHFIPDVVVSSYNQPGENPWTDVAGAYGKIGANIGGSALGLTTDVIISGGHQNEGRVTKEHANTRFKVTDIVGHPLASLFSYGSSGGSSSQGGGSGESGDSQQSGEQGGGSASGGIASGVGSFAGNAATSYLGISDEINLINDIYSGYQTVNTLSTLIDSGAGDAVSGFQSSSGGSYFCGSEATSFFPYFLSEIDPIGWRLGITELIYPATYLPGLREIGPGIYNTWGPVHPRQGFTTASEDLKACAVTATRALDIVTRQGQPHLYYYLGGGDCGPGCEPPGPSMEHDEENTKWQILSPVSSQQCEIFGDDAGQAISWGANKTRDESGGAVFNAWRIYKCCWPSDGIFLVRIAND